LATSRVERIVRNRIFQTFSALFALCIVAAFLVSLLGLGRHPVAVVIALDLSDSTRTTVMTREIQAVKAYLEENSKLKVPNQIQVIGFANKAKALTSSFQMDSQQTGMELDKALADPQLITNIGGGTEVAKALQFSTDSLGQTFISCKELLLVTDGEFPVSEDVIREISSASSQRVKINIVIAGQGTKQHLPAIETAFASVGRVNLLNSSDDLQIFFTDNFFTNINSNKKWVAFWLGAAAISLMYALILPLDEFVFQAMMKMNFTDSGKIVYLITGLSTIIIPLIVFLWSGLPFITECN
jgi:Ca-activated chloride channel homolog